MAADAGDAPETLIDEGCWVAEWSNSADDPALSIARARVPPGVTTRWHCLRGVDERYLILSGHGRVEVGEGLAQDVGVGAVVRIPAGQRQRIHNAGDDDLVFLALCTPRFTPDCYQDLGR